MRVLLIHASELKLWHFEASPYVCTRMQCFGLNNASILNNAHWKCNIEQPNTANKEPACIEWFYYACSYTIGPDRAINLALL